MLQWSMMVEGVEVTIFRAIMSMSMPQIEISA